MGDARTGLIRFLFHQGADWAPTEEERATLHRTPRALGTFMATGAVLVLAAEAA